MTNVEHQLLDAIGDARGFEAADRLCQACVGFLDVDTAAVAVVFDGANAGTFGASGLDPVPAGHQRQTPAIVATGVWAALEGLRSDRALISTAHIDLWSSPAKSGRFSSIG